MLNNYFFVENRAFCEKMWKTFSGDGESTEDNTAHAHFTLDT
jgi:hypothetical protein